VLACADDATRKFPISTASSETPRKERQLDLGGGDCGFTGSQLSGH